MLYWCDAHALRRSDLDGSNVQTLYEPALSNAVSAAAVDPDDDRVYFIERNANQQFAIHHVPLAGGTPTFFADIGTPTPIVIDADDDALFWLEPDRIVRHSGVSAVSHVPSIATPLSTFAVDHAGRRVFSASTSGPGKIWKTNLITGDSSVIHTHTRTIHTVAYDPLNDMVLWLDDLSDVHRADTTGGNVQALVTSGIISGQDLFVDPVTQKFYVADIGPDEVVQYDLDGSNETVLINMSGSLTSFAIDHDASTVYYANNSGLTRFVQKVSIGGAIPLTVLQETAFFELLRLNPEEGRLYWLVSNPRLIRSANVDGSSVTTLDLSLGAATPMMFALGPIEPLPQPGDVDGDGVVNIDDLLAVIEHWGECPPPCDADLDGNGVVNIDDLLAVILHWT
jgi:hypothetical protein